MIFYVYDNVVILNFWTYELYDVVILEFLDVITTN